MDFGLPWTPCRHPFECGFSLDNRGWLPCSPAISIARLFGREHLYRRELPEGQPWGMEELCRYCCYAFPEDFRRINVKHLAEFTPAMKLASKSWFDALRRAGANPEGPLDTQPF